jgi:hypothetical protein
MFDELLVFNSAQKPAPGSSKEPGDHFLTTTHDTRSPSDLLWGMWEEERVN